MASEGWVTMSKRISAVLGSKVMECRSTFRGHIVDWHEHFRLSMSCFVPKICGVECGSWKIVVKIGFFAHKIGRGICKLTPLPTYCPSLVEFPWLRHQTWITQFYPQITPCPPFLCKRSPDGATANSGSRHPIAAHYSSIDPKGMKGWVSLVGWPIANGLPT